MPVHESELSEYQLHSDVPTLRCSQGNVVRWFVLKPFHSRVEKRAVSDQNQPKIKN